jgi:hypothetical protein
MLVMLRKRRASDHGSRRAEENTTIHNEPPAIYPSRG